MACQTDVRSRREVQPDLAEDRHVDRCAHSRADRRPSPSRSSYGAVERAALRETDERRHRGANALDRPRPGGDRLTVRVPSARQPVASALRGDRVHSHHENDNVRRSLHAQSLGPARPRTAFATVPSSHIHQATHHGRRTSTGSNGAHLRRGPHPRDRRSRVGVTSGPMGYLLLEKVVDVERKDEPRLATPENVLH